MSHETDCGNLGQCGDMGCCPCPLILPVYGMFWIAGDSAALVWEDMILVVSLSGVHSQPLHLVCSGSTDWKIVCFEEFLNIAFHFRFGHTNITNNFENGRKVLI